MSNKAFIVLERGADKVSRLVSRISYRYVRGVLPSKEETASHALLLFSDGMRFESHAATGGFYPLHQSEVAEKKAWHVEVPLGDIETSLLRDDCRLCVGKHHYDIQLIARIGLHALMKFPVTRTPGKWDCSEACTRLLLPYGINLMTMTEMFTNSRTCPDRVQPGMIQAAYFMSGKLTMGYPPLGDR